MNYCQVHGSYSDNYDGCLECRAAAEREEADRDEIKKRLSQIARVSKDPGDFRCPHCKYKSLRWEATRCPLCHSEIESAYWSKDKWEAEARRLLASGDYAGAERLAGLTGLAPWGKVGELLDSWPACTPSEREARRLRDERKCAFCGVRGADTHQCEKCGRWFCYHCEDKSRGNTDAVFRVTRCKEHPPDKEPTSSSGSSGGSGCLVVVAVALALLTAITATAAVLIR